MLTVIFYFCCAGLAITVSLVGPIFVALLGQEVLVAQRFGFYLLVGGFVFGAPILAIAGRLRRIPQIGRLVLLFLCWIVLPICVAIPIADLTQLGVVDALFEATSGLTTAGATTLKNMSVLPRGLVFWRVQIQWLGGYLAILTVFLIIAPMGIGGLVGRRDTITQGADLRLRDSRLLIFAINMGLLYATITAFCFLALFMTGNRAYHSVTLAMTAVSTGGFLPFDKPLDENINTTGLFIMAVFFLIGATSVFWQRMLLKGNLKALTQHRESYSVIILIGLLTIGFAFVSFSVSAVGERGITHSIIEAFFHAASVVATSGVEARPGYFTLLPLVLLLFVVLLGGSAFSASGGIKHYRLGGMLVQSWSELDRLVYPHGVRPSHFGTERYDIQLMKAIWSFFVVAIITLAIGTVLIAASGVPFEAALTATIAAFSTAGPFYESGWAAPGTEAWPTYANFTPFAKSTLIALMLLGRLEVLALIGLVSARYWRNR